MPKTASRGAGAGLTREAVLHAGLVIADADGVDALSLRRVARRLGVTPMALYRYVGGKEALLDGIADLVLGELELPSSESGDWRRQLRAVARSFRAVLVSHPGALPILVTRPLFTPAGLKAADALLGLLRGAGFSAQQAVLRYQQVVRFLLALVALELGGGPSLSARDRRERARLARATLETLPRADYPHLVEAARHLATPYDPGRVFDSGLDLLVAGLEQALPGGGKRRTGL